MKIDSIKFYLKNSAITHNMYTRLKKMLYSNKFTTYDENFILPLQDNTNGYRINLVLPSLRKAGVFGGAMTAIKFFLELNKSLNINNGRIIITGPDRYDSQFTFPIKDYSYNSDQNGIVFLSESNRLRVRKDDIFICTFWTTAFYFYSVLDWQITTYNLAQRKLVYLIQDYEPYFYPWSTEYVLSESTYNHSDSTIAVFNSPELYNYFHINDYFFYEELFFSPSLNDKLKNILLSVKDNVHPRKKRIVIYGRPFEARNAFGLIYGALKLWSSVYQDAANWEIISLGDNFEDLELSNNRIVALGKLSLEEYCKMLLSSYAGISLMISPHPSYPPLEMSTFGVRTITNSYKTKDLSTFNENVYSLNELTSKTICDMLVKLCDEYSTVQTKVITSGDYIEGNDFEHVIKCTAKCLRKIECL